MTAVSMTTRLEDSLDISLIREKIPHMQASNLEIKEGGQTCDGSLCRCNKLLSHPFGLDVD